MATVEACRDALDQLAAMLVEVDPQLRARHVPARTASCRLVDHGCWFVGRLDEDGVHDVTIVEGDAPEADVRLAMTSDELIALANGEDDFLNAWLRGRVQISASMRDLLRLRSLFGL
jgi:hypothetical protein